MLRTEVTPATRVLAVALMIAVGAVAAWLVAAGNPGNMGLCGACFLRDVAGSLGFHEARGPAYFRPEVAGVMLGALLLVIARRRFVARSGSYAAMRFALGLWMAIGGLVFLGCPFRLLQRLGGGDLNAWAALPGFLLGVLAAIQLEKRGYSIGKTSPAPAAVGLVGPLVVAALLAAFLAGGILLGPGPGESGKPAHAPWLLAFGLSIVAGVILSATGFCAISATREVFQRRKVMLIAALALIAGYAAVAAATGRFALSFAGQPIAHGDLAFNLLALALLGLTGAMAGGCPVRQMVMAGEGNGDALITVSGILIGGALAHNLGLVSAAATAESAGGPTPAGRVAVIVGLAFSLVCGVTILRAARARAPK